MANVQQLKTWGDEALNKTDLNAEFANVYKGLINIETSQLSGSAVTVAKLNTGARANIREAEHGFRSYVSQNDLANGFEFNAATTLSDATLKAGIAYIKKTSSSPDEFTRIDRSSGVIPVPTLAANDTNSIFLKSDDTLRASTSSVAAANELYLIDLVTNGITVTSNTFQANKNPLTDIAFPTDYIVSLRIEMDATTPDEKVILKGGLIARDSTDARTISVGSDQTIVNTTTGANALDASTVASDTWYFIFAIDDTTNVLSPAGLLSLSATAPALPSGYNVFRRVGTIRTDATSDFFGIAQYDHEVSVLLGREAFNATAPTSFTDLDLSNFVPTISLRCVLNIGSRNVSNNGIYQLRRNGETTTQFSILFGSDGASPAAYGPGIVGGVLLDSGQILEHQVVASSGNSTTIDVNGWFDPLT